MRLENSFSVRAPIDEVWAALLDVERVVPCVPGARVLERLGDERFAVELEVALGAPSVCYRGQVAIVEREAKDRRAVLSISADGDGDRAQARLELKLDGAGELTEGKLAAEVSASGAAVGVDRGTLKAVVARLIDDFARNLAALLGGGVPTVNGSDPASSIARMPEPVGETLLGGHSVTVGQAAPVAARAEGASAPPHASTGHGERTREVPPAAAASPPHEAGWAGATRQAGATIERLRSPLGALLLAFVILAAILGLRRRSPAAERGPGDPILVTTSGPSGPVG